MEKTTATTARSVHRAEAGFYHSCLFRSVLLLLGSGLVLTQLSSRGSSPTGMKLRNLRCNIWDSNNRPGFNSLLGFYSITIRWEERLLVCYCSSPPGGHHGIHVDAPSSPLQTKATQDLRLIDEFSGSYFCCVAELAANRNTVAVDGE